MKVALCCIVKNENTYIKEYIDYYKKLGVDNIIIYDNNDINGENLYDVINDDINSGFIIMNNVKGKTTYQLPAYNDCIKKYGYSYDWIMFFDVDEYLCLVYNKNIKDYLSTFPEECDRIAINWMTMDDNDMIDNNGKPLIERLTRPIDKYGYLEYTNIQENKHVKTILRCKNLENKRFVNPHFISGSVCSMNNKGEKCAANTPFLDINWHNAYIKHFRFKTITEYLYNKILKGAPDCNYDYYINIRCTPEKFFRCNKRTKEKEEIISKFLLEHKYLYNK